MHAGAAACGGGEGRGGGGRGGRGRDGVILIVVRGMVVGAGMELGIFYFAGDGEPCSVMSSGTGTDRYSTSRQVRR